MESHEKDLRSVVESDEERQAVQDDYRSARLTPREIALLDFAVALTRSPSRLRKDDVDALRRHGLTDEQVVDAVHCISYFNFINRVLDGLGVDPEASMRYRKEAEYCSPSSEGTGLKECSCHPPGRIPPDLDVRSLD
jgi:uncharacterized peroxidase-related enzyme